MLVRREVLILRGVKTARTGAELNVGTIIGMGVSAIPQTRATMNAFLALERGNAVGALSNGLSGAHGDAGFFSAHGAEFQVAEDDVIGKAGHRLHFAAYEQSVLLGDE